MSEETKVKENLIKVKNSIRKKNHDLHNQEIELNERVQRELKPIIEPLQNIRDLVSTTDINHTPINKEKRRPSIKTQYSDNFRTAKTKLLQPKRLFTNVSNLQRKNRGKANQNKTKMSHNIENDSFAENFSSLSESEEEMEEKSEENNVPASLSQQQSTSSTKRKQSVIQDRYQTRALNNPTYYNVYQNNEKIYIGNDEVKINSAHIIIKGKKYSRTHGLLDTKIIYST